MPAYLIVYENITDVPQYEAYLKAVLPVITQRGGQMLAAGEPESLEGDLPWSRAVVFAWPSKQSIIDFWHSDEYRKIKSLRVGAAEFQVAVLDGLPAQEGER